jgi:hypothetical protein
MVKNIGIAAAVVIAAFASAPSASFAAAKKEKAAHSSSYKDVTQCTGGSCTAVNPERIPNESAQFYRRSHKKDKKGS